MANYKKKNKEQNKIDCQELMKIEASYIKELETDPELSLEVDPLGKYNLNPVQKDFISYYVQFKSVAGAAELCNIDMGVAKTFFMDYVVQQEIRRINRALYHKRFAHKLLDLNDIGGYLSSLITDENVPLGEQLKPREKLMVVNMLIDLYKLKSDGFKDPSKISSLDISSQLKNLSLDTIRQLLSQSNKKEDNKTLINDPNLLPEEKEYLNSLPTEDLLQIIDSNNKGGDANE